MAGKTHVIPVMQKVWRELAVEGRVIIVDALLTLRALAHSSLENDSDSFRLVKGNHPQLYDNLHGHSLDALRRGDEYRGRLSPLGGPAVVGFSPHRHTRQFNGPARHHRFQWPTT